jgi:hypothetical protein
MKKVTLIMIAILGISFMACEKEEEPQNDAFYLNCKCTQYVEGKGSIVVDDKVCKDQGYSNPCK